MVEHVEERHEENKLSAQQEPSPVEITKAESGSDSNVEFEHWRCEKDTDNIVWLTLDRKNASTNTLSSDVLDELDKALDLSISWKPRGLVILSGKKSGFIAGADVKEFGAIKTEKEADTFIGKGQAVFTRLENLSFPTLALINGFCLGGGLELALACQYRIAEDSANTKLGLPEVRLGIHPGFGGTVRLPKLIGALNAMDLMLTGRTVISRKAQKIGLIDYAVPDRHLLSSARKTLLSPPVPHRPGFWLRKSNHSFVRPFLAKVFIKKVAAKVSIDHYPAPYAVINLWKNYTDSPDLMMQKERQSEVGLITHESTQNLVRVFFLQEQMKSLGDKKLIQPKHVHVIGGGVMGGDIAAWCALQNMTVTVQDRKYEHLAQVLQRAFKLFSKRLRLPRLVQATMDRLIPDVNGLGLSQADVVIEAIFEDVEAKQALFREIEPQLKPDCILATNTSSIPLEELGKALKNPQRLVGLHFFNPVAQMQLVEIVHGPNTDPEIVKKACAFTRIINRLPLPVSSTPGFLVNRILMPYLLEAVAMKGEGIPATLIDKAALKFGMPMGPIELADTVGLDICLSVAEKLAQHFPVEVPQVLRQYVKQGTLGRKSGSGFYNYKKGKKQKESVSTSTVSIEEITDRLMFRMLNEATACLREKVVDNADLLDAGVIFGTGFAPFRGGPMNYIEKQGIPRMTQKLDGLKQRYGDRFNADDGWSPTKA